MAKLIIKLINSVAAVVNADPRARDWLRVGYLPDYRVTTMDMLKSGHFNPGEPGIFDPLIASIRNPEDPWMIAADFRSYIDAQRQVSARFADWKGWARMAILNVAGSGPFSSDRTICEYRDDIWFNEALRGAGDTR